MTISSFNPSFSQEETTPEANPEEVSTPVSDEEVVIVPEEDLNKLENSEQSKASRICRQISRDMTRGRDYYSPNGSPIIDSCIEILMGETKSEDGNLIADQGERVSRLNRAVRSAVFCRSMMANNTQSIFQCLRLMIESDELVQVARARMMSCQNLMDKGSATSRLNTQGIFHCFGETISCEYSIDDLREKAILCQLEQPRANHNVKMNCLRRYYANNECSIDTPNLDAPIQTTPPAGFDDENKLQPVLPETEEGGDIFDDEPWDDDFI